MTALYRDPVFDEVARRESEARRKEVEQVKKIKKKQRRVKALLQQVMRGK